MVIEIQALPKAEPLRDAPCSHLRSPYFLTLSQKCSQGLYPHQPSEYASDMGHLPKTYERTLRPFIIEVIDQNRSKERGLRRSNFEPEGGKGV